MEIDKQVLDAFFNAAEQLKESGRIERLPKRYFDDITFDNQFHGLTFSENEKRIIAALRAEIALSTEQMMIALSLLKKGGFFS